MSASRLLMIGGIALIVAGMIFGEIFAVFVLHQNAGRTGQKLLAATLAVAAQDSAGVRAQLQGLGGELEDRGTKVDTHVHLTGFGYLALLLALVQPYLAISERRKRQLAGIFLAGAVLLPIGVFLIHYVGLSYSPFAAIGWASVVADFGGLLLIIAGVWYFTGLLGSRGSAASIAKPEWLNDQSWSGRVLLTGGTLLILLGFLDGAFYAGFELYRHEAVEATLLSSMLDNAAKFNPAAATQDVSDYGHLQAQKAVHIAAHSHIIEFGLMAMLLSFIQPYIFLSERWRRRWAVVLLIGSVILPVFVLLELHIGLLAGGIADFGGLLVVSALIGMLFGVVRHSGRSDASAGAES
ncbi:MAG TPA: hypothetical protein VFA76_06160 [Terriglobales bacterium]|nr:hypothetical protein [Terriglobales bacterium]